MVILPVSHPGRFPSKIHLPATHALAQTKSMLPARRSGIIHDTRRRPPHCSCKMFLHHLTMLLFPARSYPSRPPNPSPTPHRPIVRRHLLSLSGFRASYLRNFSMYPRPRTPSSNRVVLYSATQLVIARAITPARVLEPWVREIAGIAHWEARPRRRV